jgi:hypothetical protein
LRWTGLRVSDGPHRAPKCKRPLDVRPLAGCPCALAYRTPRDYSKSSSPQIHDNRCDGPAVGESSPQGLLFVGQCLDRPAATQRTDQRHSRLALTDPELDLGELCRERLNLRNRHVQIIVESVLVGVGSSRSGYGAEAQADR